VIAYHRGVPSANYSATLQRALHPEWIAEDLPLNGEQCFYSETYRRMAENGSRMIWESLDETNFGKEQPIYLLWPGLFTKADYQAALTTDDRYRLRLIKRGFDTQVPYMSRITTNFMVLEMERL
jgi:hypothetical protein